MHIKWFKIYKDYFCGFWLPGMMFFLIQELPYAVMPFLSLPANPLMEMKTAFPLLEIFEKLFGILTVLLLTFVVNDKVIPSPSKHRCTKLLFLLALFFLVLYYAGWYFYFNGYQSLSLILILLVAMPPLYYMSLGLWRKNYPLAVNSFLFLLFHIVNVLTSLNNTSV
ncbi:MAG: hypothetical protein LBC68_05155 [Prevotellaceae bacterium]|jgi:hypothetical protein|nr:hypothetical protein [Prevotellaceae bacterium]